MLGQVFELILGMLLLRIAVLLLPALLRLVPHLLHERLHCAAGDFDVVARVVERGVEIECILVEADLASSTWYSTVASFGVRSRARSMKLEL